jgi:putative membrane protein
MSIQSNVVVRSVFALLLGFGAWQVMADEAGDFVDKASAKGIAEIETAHIALEKSQSQEVRDYAQRMIDDHTAANRELSQLAQAQGMEVSDEATLMDKGKAMVLKQRDGGDFDQAYVNNQVMAHEQTIKIFRDYIQEGENAELKRFAQSTLPKLQEHLEMAKELQRQYEE